MKEYIPKKAKEYRLDKSLYLRVLHTVRDYPRMLEKVNDIIHGNATDDGMPKSKNVGKPTEKKAIAIVETMNTINAIEDALKQIPMEYRQYIFDNVVHKIKYPDFADKMTWSRWRMRFLYWVADNLGLL